MSKGQTYKDAGVDIDAGNEAVDRIVSRVTRTHKVWTDAGGSILHRVDGSIGALKHYDGRISAWSTDGVGTKVLIAIAMQKFDTIGIDLVAMNVNDIVLNGVDDHLVFLDYIAMGKQLVERTEEIVKGVVAGCEEAGAILVGGEMAEMPGIYQDEHFDLVGSAAGFAPDHSHFVSGEGVDVGMRVYGLPSSGVHSNGFSLVRKVFGIDDNPGRLEALYTMADAWTLGEALLAPTRIYVREVQEMLVRHDVAVMAHITGGGLSGKISRALPSGCAVLLDPRQWEMAEIFHAIQQKGRVAVEEMRRTFNCGIGFVAISDEDLSDCGFVDIGEVVPGDRQVIFIND